MAKLFLGRLGFLEEHLNSFILRYVKVFGGLSLGFVLTTGSNARDEVYAVGFCDTPNNLNVEVGQIRKREC